MARGGAAPAAGRGRGKKVGPAGGGRGRGRGRGGSDTASVAATYRASSPPPKSATPSTASGSNASPSVTSPILTSVGPLPDTSKYYSVNASYHSKVTGGETWDLES